MCMYFAFEIMPPSYLPMSPLCSAAALLCPPLPISLLLVLPADEPEGEAFLFLAESRRLRSFILDPFFGTKRILQLHFFQREEKGNWFTNIIWIACIL